MSPPPPADPLLDPELEKRWWTEVTRGAALDPGTWLLCGRRLNRSAELVWSRFEAGSGAKFQDDWGDLPAALMLAGFALENLAKGLVIRKEPQRVRAEYLARWTSGSGHELRELLAKADVTLEPAEVLVVRRLEMFAQWAGRYPVPRQFADNAPIDSLGHRPPEISDDKRAAEWDVYRALYARTDALLSGPIST